MIATFFVRGMSFPTYRRVEFNTRARAVLRLVHQLGTWCGTIQAPALGALPFHVTCN